LYAASSLLAASSPSSLVNSLPCRKSYCLSSSVLLPRGGIFPLGCRVDCVEAAPVVQAVDGPRARPTKAGALSALAIRAGCGRGAFLASICSSHRSDGPFLGIGSRGAAAVHRIQVRAGQHAHAAERDAQIVLQAAGAVDAGNLYQDNSARCISCI